MEETIYRLLLSVVSASCWFLAGFSLHTAWTAHRQLKELSRVKEVFYCNGCEIKISSEPKNPDFYKLSIAISELLKSMKGNRCLTDATRPEKDT